MVKSPKYTDSHCFICGALCTEGKNEVPKNAAAQLFADERIYIHHDCRVCGVHLTPELHHFTSDAVRSIRQLTLELHTLSLHEADELVDILSKLASRPRVDFSITAFELTGITLQ